MRNKKTVYFMYEPYECSALEEYFEAMAKNGWLIKSINRPFLRFERIEPKKLKFSVDILNKISSFDPNDSEDALDYREFCEAAGWKYVCQDKKIQVFYAEDYSFTIDIHTDESEKFKSVVKASLGNIISYIFLVALWGWIILSDLTRGEISYAITSNFIIVSSMSICIFIFVYISKIISFIIWFFKAKKKVKENKLMPYNKYKQVKLKNKLLATYGILCLILYAVFLFSDSDTDIIARIIFLVLFLAVIIGSIFITSYIRSKKYPRDTNIALTMGGGVIYIFIFLTLSGVLIGGSTLKPIDEKAVNKVELTFKDFGYEENYDTKLYIDYSKSIVAEKTHYGYSKEDNSLSYTLLESRYPWIIKLQEERLLEWLSEFREDLKPIDTNLPNNIKVYSDKDKETYILVSKDKVVEMNKRFNDLDENKFLNIVYEKMFND